MVDTSKRALGNSESNLNALLAAFYSVDKRLLHFMLNEVGTGVVNTSIFLHLIIDFSMNPVYSSSAN